MKPSGILSGAAIVIVLSSWLSAAAQDRLGGATASADPYRNAVAASGRDPSSGAPASLVLISGSIGTQRAYGCGVIIDEQRSTVTILTAAHNLAITGADFTTVTGERLRAEQSRVIPGHDLALVTIERPWRSHGVARFGPLPVAGTPVHVWGPIKNDPFTAQTAIVREIVPGLTDLPAGAFAIDCAACDHGDSGTGVFNDRDELIGIVTSAYSTQKQRLFVLSESYRPDSTVASASGPSGR